MSDRRDVRDLATDLGFGDEVATRLAEREDRIVEALMAAAVQFGAMPGLARKAIYDVGLGTTQPDDVEALMAYAFSSDMATLRAWIEGQEPT